MGSLITSDGTPSPDTLPSHRPDRRRRLEPIEQPSATMEHGSAAGPDTGRIEADDDSTLSRIIEVRNGHRAMGRARDRLMQTSLIFQALLVMALALSIVAIMQFRSAPAGGSPDADPPSVLVQVSD